MTLLHTLSVAFALVTSSAVGDASVASGKPVDRIEAASAGVSAPESQASRQEPRSPSGRLSVHDGPQQVEILRDTWGVPHIYGDTAEASMYGFGWAQA